MFDQFEKAAGDTCVCRVIEFSFENCMFRVQVEEEFFKQVFRQRIIKRQHIPAHCADRNGLEIKAHLGFRLGPPIRIAPHCIAECFRTGWRDSRMSG
jgi:hypothetical protein